MIGNRLRIYRRGLSIQQKNVINSKYMNYFISTNPKIKLLSLLICVLLVNVFASCSKDSKREPVKEDKIITVSIEHEGDIEKYQGFLNVNGTLDSDLKRVNVSGVSWDEEVTEGEISLLTKTLIPVSKKIEIKTDRPVSGIQFGYTAWLIGGNDLVITPLAITIRYTIDDKIVKTESFIAGKEGSSAETYLGRLEVSDY